MCDLQGSVQVEMYSGLVKCVLVKQTDDLIHSGLFP